MSNKITIFKGDSRTITITITNADDTAFNLTGYTMLMTAKENKTDADPGIFQNTATISSPLTGIGSIAISKTNTAQTVGEYFYDVQVSDGTNVFTVVSDIFSIQQDITT